MNSKVLSLFVIFSLQLFSQTMDPAANTYYRLGSEKIKAKDFQNAVAYYDSALLTSQDHRIFYYKGIALRMLERNNDAIAVFNECIKVNPNYDQTYNALGSAYYVTNNMDLAIANFKKFIEITTDTARVEKVREYIGKAYTKIAIENLGKRNPTLSIANLDEAKNYNKIDDISSYYAKAYTLIATDLISRNSMDSATYALDKAVEYNKSDSIYYAKSYCQIASELINRNSYDSANKVIEKALALNQLDIAYLYLAKLNTKTENWDAAIANSEKALSLKSNISIGGPNLYLGISFRAKGDKAKAKKYLNIAQTDEKYKKSAEAELQKIK